VVALGVETGTAEDWVDMAPKVAREGVAVQVDLATAAAEATVLEAGVKVEAEATVLVTGVKEMAPPTIEWTQRVARQHLQTLDL
jgi:hypothetical protein